MADVPGVAIVIGIFFVAGLAVGGIAVVALSMLRARRARTLAGRRWPGDPGDADSWPGDADSWPGDADNGHYRR